MTPNTGVFRVLEMRTCPGWMRLTPMRTKQVIRTMEFQELEETSVSPFPVYFLPFLSCLSTKPYGNEVSTSERTVWVLTPSLGCLRSGRLLPKASPAARFLPAPGAAHDFREVFLFSP